MENEATPKCRVCGSTDVGARYDGQSFCRSCGAVVAPCAVCGSYDIAKSHDGTFFCRACGARGSALDGKAKAGKPSLSGKKRTFFVIGAILAALLITVIVLFATGVFGGGSLIGKWAFGANHWQFNDDGTFSANVNTLNYEGTYTAEDGKLHIDTDFFGLKKSLDYDYAIKGKKLTLTGDVTLTGAGSMTLEYERIWNKSASSGKKPGDTTAAPTNDPGNTAEETGKTETEPTETTEPAETTVPVSSVSLNESNITLTAGETATLSCSVLPENATDPTVSWASSNTAVATVENGTVAAQAQGFAVILAKTADGKTAECWVTVTENTDFEFQRIENGGGYRLVKYYGSDASVVIPSTYNGKKVEEIGESAFRDCTAMRNLTIPNTVTNIGAFAFRDCTELTSITIPNSVTDIGTGAFYGCKSLTYNKYDGEDYLGCAENPYIVLVKAANNTKTINNNTRVIYDDAFSGCIGLTSITVPSTVTSIGACAFQGCTGLTSITIPNSVTRIDGGAFYDTGLTSVTYTGTKDQWYKASGESRYLACVVFNKVTIVHCSDGQALTSVFRPFTYDTYDKNSLWGY